MGVTLTPMPSGYKVEGFVPWEEFVDKVSDKPAISKDGRDFSPKDKHYKSATTQVRFRNQPWRNGEIASQLRLQCVIIARGVVKPPSEEEVAALRGKQATLQAFNSLTQAYMLTGMTKEQAEAKAHEQCAPLRDAIPKRQETGTTAPPSTKGEVGTVTTRVEAAAAESESDLTDEEREAIG